MMNKSRAVQHLCFLKNKEHLKGALITLNDRKFLIESIIDLELQIPFLEKFHFTRRIVFHEPSGRRISNFQVDDFIDDMVREIKGK